ncbi:MAG: tRNA preQ1(34) S-adenosylmethionine ribosyltransferase-isomerase QueA [Patescibacteria group bacterium]|jgi:S-adenosylmethionine:tRNA ribosyltransferase-isomerase
MNLDAYDYLLPEKNLALSPSVPRDSSKLFVYDTKSDEIIFDHFYNLSKYIPSNSFMVLNNTKVLPARVTMKKESGGKVVLLFLVNELTGSRVIRSLTDRKINVGEKIYFDKENYLKIIAQKENIFDLRLNFSREHLFELLNKYGTMPIPPYLKKSPLKRDELLQKYQTIFAKTDGSSAAPTASLHFTDNVFNKLDKKGIKKLFVTLHVGLGTFAPITDDNIKQKKLHEEYYEIDGETLQSIDRLKQEGKKLVAVGTTVVRTLETEVRYRNFLSQRGPLHPESEKNLVPSPLKQTNLFIFPHYDFKMVDVMVTNFHLPKSSLMMLVEAFLQYKGTKRRLVELYNIAIKEDFRFYSFGDVMMIL